MNALDPDSTGLLLLAVLSVIVLAVSSAGDSAIDRLSRARFQHLVEERTTRFGNLVDFLDHPDRFRLALDAARSVSTLVLPLSSVLLAVRLGLTQLGIVAVCGGALVAAFLAGPVFSRVALARPEEVTLALAMPIRVLTIAFTPLSVLFGLLAAPFGARAAQSADEEATEELREMLEDRIVEEDEREMIDGIFDLEETTTREIMVPRMDVVALPADTSLQEALDVIIRDGYSRLPVFRSSIDDVIGILYAKDLFPRMRDGRLDGVVGELVRPAYFIPESKKVSELLRELQKRKVHIAVAVDEYGGTSGLVTIEDLLEEIVGEIQDEFDSEEAKIVEGSEGEAFFDATVSIDDVNDTLGTILEGEEVDTIGGLVYELLGRVPLVGDQVSTSNSSITVVSTSGRRVTRVRVNRTDLEAAGAPPLADSA